MQQTSMREQTSYFLHGSSSVYWLYITKQLPGIKIQWKSDFKSGFVSCNLYRWTFMEKINNWCLGRMSLRMQMKLKHLHLWLQQKHWTRITKTVYQILQGIKCPELQETVLLNLLLMKVMTVKNREARIHVKYLCLPYTCIAILSYHWQDIIQRFLS